MQSHIMQSHIMQSHIMPGISGRSTMFAASLADTRHTRHTRHNMASLSAPPAHGSLVPALFDLCLQQLCVPGSPFPYPSFHLFKFIIMLKLLWCPTNCICENTTALRLHAPRPPLTSFATVKQTVERSNETQTSQSNKQSNDQTKQTS